ncbi:MAG: dockerin type I repeat-containing protein [Clostridia bacterium]|nr:dockerin type I repeat-containing protein [Clostridia bacterium]
MKKAFSALLTLALLFTSTVFAFAAVTGDINSDGKVNSTDALGILKYTVGATPSKFDKSVADVNADGKINSTDALAVLRIAVGTVNPPSSSAEIINLYNNAVNKAVSSKAGFKKSRVTVLHNLEGGALLKIQLVVDMVNDFLGVGTTQWDNKKGKQDNLSKASLTASDIKHAYCTENNGLYTVTLSLKDGSSSANISGNSDTSPLQRAGVFAGKGDKRAYDYKNSENIYAAINGVDECTAESALEKVTNTKITAVIDSKTGNLQSLTASWDWYVELTNVKYTVVGIKQAKGNATTTVKITDFNY